MKVFALLTPLRQLQQPLQKISLQFANQNAQQLASRTNLQAILSQAPSLVTQPLGYTIDNLRPFDIPVYVNPSFQPRFILNN